MNFGGVYIRIYIIYILYKYIYYMYIYVRTLQLALYIRIYVRMWHQCLYCSNITIA